MRKKRLKIDERIKSFLGKEVQFEGKLTFDGVVKIDGHFKGEIRAKSGNLIVGDEGVVEADIHVASVLCSGEIRGRINADERVNVRVPGKILGDIRAPTVVIEEGVQFEGNCKTTSPRSSNGPDNGQVDSNGLRSVQSLPASPPSEKKDRKAG